MSNKPKCKCCGWRDVSDASSAGAEKFYCDRCLNELPFLKTGETYKNWTLRRYNECHQKYSDPIMADMAFMELMSSGSRGTYEPPVSSHSDIGGPDDFFNDSEFLGYGVGDV